MILLVGGTFDENKGKQSYIVNEMYKCIRSTGLICHLENGGNYKDIQRILNNTIGYEIVIWMPNVLGDVEKHRNVKEINPRCMLIGSKRNNNEYDFGEVVKRALEQKLNLCIQFTKTEQPGRLMSILDPLGNIFYEGYDIQEMVKVLINRTLYLKKIHRMGSYKGDEIIHPQINEKFLELVKDYAETFHELIQAQTSRFLGNCSTRCMRGFPSVRDGQLIYVSKRNVDKRYIDNDAFVACQLTEKGVKYFSENKPSVDTPIQLSLYKELPNINYMIHSHCYIKGAMFTDEIIPCGGLEEIDAILKLIPDKNTEYAAINLKGHGSTIMVKDVKNLENIAYIPRLLPEKVIY